MMAPDNMTTEVTIDDSEPESSQHTTTEEESGTITVDATPMSTHTVWFKSLPGQLMCMQMVFSFFAFIAIISGYHFGESYWFFSLVAILSFLWSVCVVVVHLFQLYRRFANFPWMTIELVTAAVFVLAWFIADMLVLGRLTSANSGAAMMCGIFAFLTYCGCLYIGVMEYLVQIRSQGTPMPSATKAADRADGGGGGDSDSNSEDSLSEMPTVYPIA